MYNPLSPVKYAFEARLRQSKKITGKENIRCMTESSEVPRPGPR